MKRHDFRQAMRGHLGLSLGALAVMLVLGPFGTVGIPGDSIFEVAVTHDQMMYRFVRAPFVLPVYAAALIYSALLALVLFGFLLSKQQSIFYLSLSLKRSDLTGIRVAAGACGMAAAALIPLLVSCALNRIALGPWAGEMTACLFSAAGLFLQMMTVFLITAAAAALAGTMKEACLNALVFLAGPSGILYGIDRLLHFVWGNPRGAVLYSGEPAGSGTILEAASGWNPLTFFYHDFTDSVMFSRDAEHTVQNAPDPLRLIYGLILAALLLVLLHLAVRMRRAEQAGFCGQNRILNTIVMTVCGTCLFCFVYSLFADSSPVTAVIFGTAALAVLMAAARKAFPTGDGSGIGFLIRAAVQVIGAIVLCIGILTGGKALLSRIPDQQEVDSVKVTYAGSPSYMTTQAAGISSSRGYYITSEVRVDDPDAIGDILELNRDIGSLGRRAFKTDQSDFTRTVVPYDVSFTYRLKDGTSVRRYYDRVSLELLERLVMTEDSAQIRQRQSELITGGLTVGSDVNWTQEAYTEGSIYLSDRWFDEVYEMRLTDDDRAALLTALAADVSAQTMEDRYFPKEDALGILYFTTEGETDLDSFSWHLGCAPICLTESFANTMAFLEKQDMLKCLDVRRTLAESGPTGNQTDEDRIEEIYLQKYDPYAGINGRKQPLSNVFLSYCADDLDSFIVQADFGEMQPVTDPERIARIAKNMRSTYCMTREGYLAAVRLAGSDRYVYKYIPGGSDAVR